MKLKLLFAICLISLPALAGKTVRLTVNWTFTNVIEGYDHNNKIVVYVDNKMLGESPEYLESNMSSYSVDVPKGKHTLRIENYAFYQDKWEIHRKTNGYSVDAYYENEVTFGSSNTLDMVCDIDSETTTIKVIGMKEAPKKGTALTVTWTFDNVIEGYDHQNRIEVYSDGELLGTSDIQIQSKQGKITVIVPDGTHEISVMTYAYYEGNWEEHTVDNDYSMDASYSSTMTFNKKKRTINLVFDIETLDTKVTVK
jgi:hypothetical protein